MAIQDKEQEPEMPKEKQQPVRPVVTVPPQVYLPLEMEKLLLVLVIILVSALVIVAVAAATGREEVVLKVRE